MTNMKRPKTHQIDEQAMRVFRDALPTPWVPTPQTPDYGKDYLVEIATGDDLSGLIFFVQLKGEEKVKLSKDGKHVTFYLKTKHAKYYLDKVTVPVFLVVVDVTKKVGYWLFTQEYLRDKLTGQVWRRKASVAIHLPTANTLTKTEAVRKAVEQSRVIFAEMMAVKTPEIGSAQPSLNRSRLEPQASLLGTFIPTRGDALLFPRPEVARPIIAPPECPILPASRWLSSNISRQLFSKIS